MLTIEDLVLLRELLTIKCSKEKVKGVPDEKISRYEELSVKLTKMMKQIGGNDNGK